MIEIYSEEDDEMLLTNPVEPKRLKLEGKENAEAYSEPSQRSKMEKFAKKSMTVSRWQDLQNTPS